MKPVQLRRGMEKIWLMMAELLQQGSHAKSWNWWTLVESGNHKAISRVKRPKLNLELEASGRVGGSIWQYKARDWKVKADPTCSEVQLNIWAEIAYCSFSSAGNTEGTNEQVIWFDDDNGPHCDKIPTPPYHQNKNIDVGNCRNHIAAISKRWIAFWPTEIRYGYKHYDHDFNSSTTFSLFLMENMYLKSVALKLGSLMCISISKCYFPIVILCEHAFGGRGVVVVVLQSLTYVF